MNHVKVAVVSAASFLLINCKRFFGCVPFVFKFLFSPNLIPSIGQRDSGHVQNKSVRTVVRLCKGMIA